MKLPGMFPECSVRSDPASDFPSAWNQMLADGPNHAGNRVSDRFELPQGSNTRAMLSDVVEIGVLVPRKKKDSKNQCTWRLCLLLPHEHAVFFYFPAMQFLSAQFESPAQYREVATCLGALQFSRFSGRLIWPTFVEEKSRQISQLCSRRVIPFFNHLTGDYDCWVDDGFSDTWSYDHETCRLNLYSTGGFAQWFDKRFTFYTNLR